MTGRESGISRNRRIFLKQTAHAAAAATASGLSLARAAHASGSDILKVGLIGCGGRGSGAAVNAMNADPNARLVAMADVFPWRAAEKPAAYQGRQA